MFKDLIQTLLFLLLFLEILKKRKKALKMTSKLVIFRTFFRFFRPPTLNLENNPVKSWPYQSRVAYCILHSQKTYLVDFNNFRLQLHGALKYRPHKSSFVVPSTCTCKTFCQNTNVLPNFFHVYISRLNMIGLLTFC